MSFPHSFLLILSLLSFLFGSASVNAILFERGPSSQWSKRSRVPRDVILPVRIALARSNIEKGEEFLMQVSDPFSPSFGKHWTPEEVFNKFAPSLETVDTTIQWLVQSGIDESGINQSLDRGALAFDTTIGELETLLQTEYFHYEHDAKEYTAVACDRYSIPAHLDQHIDYITPGTSLRSMITKPQPANVQPRNVVLKGDPTTSETSTSTTCSAYYAQTGVPPSALVQYDLVTNLSICSEMQLVTPACLRALYQIPENITANPANSMAIFATTGTYDHEDMDMFFQYIAPNIPVGTEPIKLLINGAQMTPSWDPSNGAIEEGNLDFQTAWSLLYPLNISLLYSQPTTAQNASINQTGLEQLEQQLYYDFYDAFAAIDGTYCTNISGPQCGAFKPPNVISFSYGIDEMGFTQQESNRLCNEILKLGLQGVTLVLASSDSGVETPSGSCLGPEGNAFGTSSLANCPWGLAVGATMLNGSVSSPEVVANVNIDEGDHYVHYTSGGGFSLFFPSPSYQQSTLNTYFTQHDPGYPSYNYMPGTSNSSSIGAGGGRYNRLGRGYPDVAANGAFLLNVDAACAVQQYGTSGATPIVASMIALVNNERMNAGKGPVGFVNPVLYANPGVFNDVVAGHNVGCGTDGFSAVEGWDPASGLGTFNFPRLLEVFMALP